MNFSKALIHILTITFMFMGLSYADETALNYNDVCIENPNTPKYKCAVDYGIDNNSADKNDGQSGNGSANGSTGDLNNNAGGYSAGQLGQDSPSSMSSNSSNPNNGSANTAVANGQEQCVVVKGSASSEGVSKAFARKMAIRDALQQASLKNNVVVKTDQSVEGYQLKLDSSRFISNSKVKSFDVLKEGYEEASDMYGKTKTGPLNYEVTMNVCLTEDSSVCSNLPGNKYQTRLAIAPVVFPFANQANDISNLLNGYQLELERRIRNQGYKNYTLLSEPVDLQDNIQVAPNLDSESMSNIRNQTGAQYLLLTVLRSMSSHQEDTVLNSMKRLYDLEVKPSDRFVEADWYLVDLINNEVVHQSRGGFDVHGDVVVGRDRPFGSNAFFGTNTGKVFHALLHKEVTDTTDYLNCKSFESEIIDVRDNEYIIYLNANSGAKVGDDLAVYHKTGRPVRFGGQDLGVDQLPGAFLKITRILPKFAVAEVTVKKGLIQVGDRVRTW